MLRVLAEEGLGGDVSSPAELAAALRAGMAPERLVLHGNAKGEDEINSAVRAGAGLVVVDALGEAARVAAAARRAGRVQPVAVRVTPGIRAGGHAAIETGGAGSKFGLGPADAAAAVAECEALDELAWAGLHVHLGSQIDDVRPLQDVVGWLRGFCDEHGLAPSLLDLGGGLGIAYGAEAAGDPGELARALVRSAGEAFPGARLVLEPGRSVSGPAGVTLYTVVATKRAADGTRWVAVDGGMADNPRASRYGARYTALAADRVGEPLAPPSRWPGATASRATCWSRSRTSRPSSPATSSRWPRRAPTTSRWRPPTTACRAPRRSSSRTAPSTLVTRRETLDELLAREI